MAKAPAAPAAAEQLLTIQEVMSLLRVSRFQVYKLLNSGEFGEIIRLGPQSQRITAAGYAAYLERNRVAS